MVAVLCWIMALETDAKRTIGPVCLTRNWASRALGALGRLAPGKG